MHYLLSFIYFLHVYSCQLTHYLFVAHRPTFLILFLVILYLFCHWRLCYVFRFPLYQLIFWCLFIDWLLVRSSRLFIIVILKLKTSFLGHNWFLIWARDLFLMLIFISLFSALLFNFFINEFISFCCFYTTFTWLLEIFELIMMFYFWIFNTRLREIIKLGHIFTLGMSFAASIILFSEVPFWYFYLNAWGVNVFRHFRILKYWLLKLLRQVFTFFGAFFGSLSSRFVEQNLLTRSLL